MREGIKVCVPDTGKVWLGRGRQRCGYPILTAGAEGCGRVGMVEIISCRFK